MADRGERAVSAAAPQIIVTELMTGLDSLDVIARREATLGSSNCLPRESHAPAHEQRLPSPVDSDLSRTHKKSQVRVCKLGSDVY